MWQRIQTVFLVIVVLSMIGSILFPLWVYPSINEATHQLFVLHYTDKTKSETMYFPYSITAILIVATATVSLNSIRSYNNRPLQLKLGLLNSFLLLGSMICVVIFSNALVKTYNGGKYGAGLWMIALGTIANFAANRFIRKDEKLVRDADRLR